MKRSFGNWAGFFLQDLASSVTDRFIPAHPILALFSFLAAIFFFFGLIIAFVLGVYSTLLFYFPQETAIWILFGSFFVFLIISLIFGKIFLKPKKIQQSMPSLTQNLEFKKPDVQKIVVSFLEGFFNK